MNALGLAFRQVRYENRSFWRNPAAAFFTVVFPLMFLVIFNLVFGEGTIQHFGREVSTSNFYVPAIAAFSVITACYTNLAMNLTFARDEGILKRRRGTPLPTPAFLLGKILHSSLIALLLVFVVTVFGALFYDVEIPTDKLPALIVTVMVGAAAFSSLALAIQGFVPNADAAPAVINFSILPLLFISDIFIPLENAPEWLNTFAGVFPIKHYSEAMMSAFNPFDNGSGFEWVDLAVVGLWGLVGLAIASRFFSWEPRR
jgi:ABC-2 type transport system permease protein